MPINTPEISSRMINSIAFVLSFLAGAVTSPAFFFGTLVNGKKGAAIASMAAFGWSAIQWKLTTSYVGSASEGFFFEARNARLSEFALNEAFDSALVMTICAFFTGIIARWLYENYKTALVPVCMVAVAGCLLIIGGNNLHSSENAFAEAIGSERGRMSVVKTMQAETLEIGQQVATTDREKLLVAYVSYVATRKGLGGDKTFVMSFEDFLSDIAAECIAGSASYVCNIVTMKDIEKVLVNQKTSG